MTCCCTCRCKFSLSELVEQSISGSKIVLERLLVAKQSLIVVIFFQFSSPFNVHSDYNKTFTGLSWLPLEANESSTARNSSSITRRKIQGVEHFSLESRAQWYVYECAVSKKRLFGAKFKLFNLAARKVFNIKVVFESLRPYEPNSTTSALAATHMSHK